MTVTEAQILGTPCIVTDYSSASEQIENRVDGLITENSTEGIVSALKHALGDRETRENFSKALIGRSFDNADGLKKLYSVIE